MRSGGRLLAAHLLVILVAVMWFNSYLMSDWVHYYKPLAKSPALFVHASSDHGVLVVSWTQSLTSLEPGWNSSFHTGTTLSGARWRGTFLGFDAYLRTGGAGFQLPYWFLALLTSIPAVRSWRRRFRESRLRRLASSGLCPACGYDLRASPGRCPECGRVADARGPA